MKERCTIDLGLRTTPPIPSRKEVNLTKLLGKQNSECVSIKQKTREETED
jgi:hypothetical protein